MDKKANFRFYGILNDFLPATQKTKEIIYPFWGKPALKDAIEALGVPHPEVDVVLVNGKSISLNYLLQANDTIAVYPAGTGEAWPRGYSLQVALPIWDKFILDVHLGKLAKSLRLLGFDTTYQNDYDDKTIVQLSVTENRIVLTRDIGLLKHKAVQRGYWLRSQHSEEQLAEVLAYFKLISDIKPFTRCLVCNGSLTAAPKEAVLEKLPPKTKRYFHEFHLCQSCGRVFWKGSHFERMEQFVQRVSLK